MPDVLAPLLVVGLDEILVDGESVKIQSQAEGPAFELLQISVVFRVQLDMQNLLLKSNMAHPNDETVLSKTTQHPDKLHCIQTWVEDSRCQNLTKCVNNLQQMRLRGERLLTSVFNISFSKITTYTQT